MSRLRRTGYAGVLAALVLAAAGGCSDDPPNPQGAATDLAAGLSSYDLARVPLTPDTAAPAAEQVARVREGMRELRPSVRVLDVAAPEDSARATATLALDWDLPPTGGTPWSYTTTVPLELVEDRWQVRWATTALHPELGEGDRLVVSDVAPERADILGANRQVLVTNRPVLRFGIDKTQVPAAEAAASARRLGALLDISAEPFADRVEAAGPKAFVEAIVLRADSEPPAVDQLEGIPGAVALSADRPLAPTRTFAAPLLGSVGPATAEIVQESGGRVQPDDQVGLSGLQERYDDQLRGRPGATVTLRPPEGSQADPKVLHRSAPGPGAPVHTTLDLDLQAAAEKVLAPVEPPSALVALRPSTGEVLAAVSGPGSGAFSTATVGSYPPGSTFKVVTALALLRDGATPSTTLPCTETVTVDGRRFSNYSDYPADALGEIPLSSALANSCNTAFIASRESAAQEALSQAAASLGLGGDYPGFGAPAFAGSVPTDGGATDQAASTIGQGRVTASPLAMASVAASVAAGRTVTPSLVVGPPGSVAAPAPATPPLSADEASQLAGLMRGVVTGGSARLLADLGPDVRAKTGTAEYGEQDPPGTHAWMIASRGDLAVAVFVEDGESGSKTAGPLMAGFLEAVPG